MDNLDIINLLQDMIDQIAELAPVPNAQQDPTAARESALAQAMNVIERQRRQLIKGLPYSQLCNRCHVELKAPARRWCSECEYPGIDDDYREYMALIEEGHPRHQAAVQSGWRCASEFMEDA